MRSVKSIIETLEGNKVKVSIEIDEVEFDRNIDQAFRKIAKEVRIPGFRPGKAPRQLLQAQIGLGAARSQALQDAIPEYLSIAVREHDIDLIATPQIQILNGEIDGPIAFDATCEVRPEVFVPGYNGLRVELPTLIVGDSDIDEVVTSERRRHGKLKDVDRAIVIGDQVTLDISGVREGTAVPGLNVEDWLYEVGKGWVSKSFDKHLTGAVLNQHVTFSEAPNGTTGVADMSITVKKIQEMELDDLTDEWVSEHVAEHDSIDDWKKSIRERLELMKLNQARNVFVERTTSALGGLVSIEVPEAMVASDLQSRVKNTVEQFQAQGVALDQWLSATGQSTESFIDTLRTQSQTAVKVDLALRAVAVNEDIVVGEDELDSEFQRIAMQVGRKMQQVRKAYEKNDAVTELKAQIRKSKAVDWLLHNVTLVDPEGHEISTSAMFGDDSQEESTDQPEDATTI